MWQWLANSKLTRVRKFRIPFVEEKFVTCFLVLYLRKSFLRDYNGKGVQKRVIILINTFKAEGTLANDSLYIMKLNQFSSFRIFLREPDAQVEIKFDKGESILFNSQLCEVLIILAVVCVFTVAAIFSGISEGSLRSRVWSSHSQ